MVYQIDTLKRHTKKIVVGALILGSLIGVKSCRDNTGEVVYSGTIDGYETTYEEERFVPFFSGERLLPTGNVMVLKKDEKTYRFEDYSQNTRLFRGGQKDLGHLIDVLDLITINDNSGDARHYYLKGTYYSPMDYEEQFVLDMKKREAEEFAYCNTLYREIRGKIQNMLVK